MATFFKIPVAAYNFIQMLDPRVLSAMALFVRAEWNNIIY